KPVPFVPRHLRFEVTERMTHLGAVVQPLGDIGAVIEQIAASNVTAVAICLLHAWANPAHERQLADAVRDALPGVSVVASHQVSGQWRGDERSTAAPPSRHGHARL